MELQSPLTQQARPDVFKPKVVEIYEQLFQNEHVEISEGLWRELFLLHPDAPGLNAVLSSLSPQDLLQHDEATHGLFERASRLIRQGDNASTGYALDTLTVFLDNVLNKRYSNPSSDIITLLAGLDDIDAVFSDFVLALDVTLRDAQAHEARQKAVGTALAAVTGAYQTGLLSYFVNRDLFPSLIKLIQDAEDERQLVGAFVLLGLLANYNKFEFQNPYQLRISDYLNDGVMKKLIGGLAPVLVGARDQYLQLQPDLDESWSVGGAISYISLGLYKPVKGAGPMTPLNEQQVEAGLAQLPAAEMAVILPLYDFVNSNKHFCLVFASAHAEEKGGHMPFGAFLSLVSYTLHNAHRSSRASTYSCLALLILRIMVEDAAVARTICLPENATAVRICRQRQPLLPPVTSPRPLAATLLDVIVDGINHNLRRRLDIELYIILFSLELRLITYLGRSRTRLHYHWAELWRSCLSFVRFMNQYAQSLKPLARIDHITSLVTRVLALSLSTGENFLPDAKSYDDLFYKIIESGHALEQFRHAFGLTKSNDSAAPISVLLNVWNHYGEVLKLQVDGGKKSTSPREVLKLIKQGYDTLSLQATEGLDHWELYREADHRNLIKRMTRAVVHDARAWSKRSSSIPSSLGIV